MVEATFLPIVRPEKLESFLADWAKWFVLEDTNEDSKTPGKLKSKYGFMVIIVLGTY